MDKKIIKKLLLIIGIFLISLSALIAILTLLGIVQPSIFPTTGKPLDVIPLVNVICWFLMLLIILYVGSRIIDWSIKYMSSDEN